MSTEDTIHDPVVDDVLVIGGGGAGLAAALTASESGSRAVRVLEKRGATGGNTAMATGLFACESPVQARQRIVADIDVLFKRMMDWSHWSPKVNPRIIRAVLEKSGPTIAWLEDMGLKFNVIAFFPNQNPRVEHVPEGKGAQLMRTLAELCRERRIDIITNCDVQGIDRQKDGMWRIDSVKSGTPASYHSASVIIATGGFGGNERLMAKLCPDYYKGMPVRGLSLEGDGLELAVGAGAAVDEEATLLKEGPRIDQHTWPLGGLERMPGVLWVNAQGQRFADESTGEHPFVAVNTLLRQPDRVCYTVIDANLKQATQGLVPNLDQSLETEIQKGRACKAETFTALANWIGAEAAVLQDTIEEYNRSCKSGRDTWFAKETRYLKPVLVPPFYVLRGYPSILDTLGGIKVNERMEALNDNNQAVPGLFAAGTTTGGWQAETYSGDLSGTAFGYAINSGRIAGESAACFRKQA